MASLFAALTTAVSGLNAQSSAIGNISDNLANSQTVGFKSVGTNFKALVNASSATVNNPGGVSATPQYQNDVQGSITSSNTSTSLAISGQGYFSVVSASTDSTGATSFGSTFYTRQGDFTLDKDGYMVNGSGYYLQGYTTQDSTGAFSTASTAPVQVSALLNNPVQTSTVDYAANLPANAAVGFTSSVSTVQIYDSLGVTHDLSYTWSKTATNDWNLSIKVKDGLGTGSDYTATVPMVFDNGSTYTAGTIKTISSSGGSGTYTVSTPLTSGSTAGLTMALSFAGTSAQTVALDFGTYGGSSGLTQFSDSNTSVSVTNFNQNGLPRGSYDSLSISKDGLVTINYSNGTTRTIAEIPIVQFNAQDQLQRITGGAYQATLASGTARYSTAGTIGAGTISAGSLEASNVDIATQFTTLIQAQQVYSANAKVITADNQLLQTTINMVQ